MRIPVTLLAAAAVVVSFAALAPSCAKGNEAAPTAVVVMTAPPSAAGGATFAGAERAEALLKAANVPFVTREDLIPRTWPEGCAWLAAYGTEDGGVTLETFAFTDVIKAEDYITNRNADFDVMGKNQEHMIVNNGVLVLVAWYEMTLDGDENLKRHGEMGTFAGAFAGDE